MYFEPFHLTDMVCIDGGVSQNNPLESAYLEVKKIWGEHVVFDSLLSIGTGHAKRPAKHPDSDSISDDWLKAAIENFMASMDGETAWSKFCEGLNKDMKGKAKHLNIRFKDPIEPALDDTTAVSSMALEAEDFPFNHTPNLPTSITGLTDAHDALQEAAAQIRASLFYFHPSSVTIDKGKTVATIKGVIYCRLDTDELAFAELHSWTLRFIHGPGDHDAFTHLPSCSQCMSLGRLIHEVEIQHEVEQSLVSVFVKFKSEKLLRELIEIQLGHVSDTVPSSLTVQFQYVEFTLTICVTAYN